MKKLYWLALTGILLLALISGCPSGTEDTGGNAAGDPATETTVTPSDDVSPSTEGS